MNNLKNYNICSSMDDLSNDKRDERLTGIQSLYTQATGVFVLLLIGYSFLLKYNIVGPFGYLNKILFKDSEILNDAYNLIFENVILASLFFILLVIVRFFYQKSWIAKNKKIWIKGLWLHIHIKNDSSIRIGYVNITQSFDSINAVAHNYDAMDITNPDKRTTWEYYNAQIDNKYLRGFYHSDKAAQTENSGMHRLKIVNRTFDFPTEMDGFFCDNYLLNGASLSDVTEHRQHSGKLILYRMTKEQEEILVENGEITPEKILDLINDSHFKNDEFVKRYNKVKNKEV